jgi:hypothetical protein
MGTRLPEKVQYLKSLLKAWTYSLGYGSLYRGVTWFALQNCLNEDGTIDLNELFSSFDQIELEFKNVGTELVLFLIILIFLKKSVPMKSQIM